RKNISQDDQQNDDSEYSTTKIPDFLAARFNLGERGLPRFQPMRVFHSRIVLMIHQLFLNTWYRTTIAFVVTTSVVTSVKERLKSSLRFVRVRPMRLYAAPFHGAHW